MRQGSTPRISPNVNIELSRKVARRIAAAPKQCFLNALRAQPLLEGSLYVEGWVFIADATPLPIEHGWVEHGGQIVDPTLRTRSLDKDALYFPGKRFNLREAISLSQKHKRTPLVYEGRSYHGFACREYRLAYRAALRCVESVGARATLLTHLDDAYPGDEDATREIDQLWEEATHGQVSTYADAGQVVAAAEPPRARASAVQSHQR